MAVFINHLSKNGAWDPDWKWRHLFVPLPGKPLIFSSKYTARVNELQKKKKKLSSNHSNSLRSSPPKFEKYLNHSYLEQVIKSKKTLKSTWQGTINLACYKNMWKKIYGTVGGKKKKKVKRMSRLWCTWTLTSFHIGFPPCAVSMIH